MTTYVTILRIIIKIYNDSSTILNSMTNKNQPGIVSISRSACILFCLSNGMNSLTEIAKDCGYSKPTVHRLLKALEAASLVTQDPLNNLYYLGELIPVLSTYPQNAHHSLIAWSFDEMKRISDISDETVVLGIHAGVQFVRLHSIPSKHNLRIAGTIQPTGRAWFAGSMARVLFSQRTDKELEVTFKNAKLEPVTENTITDKKTLIRLIELARQRGYEVSYSEVVDGVLGIAAPISNYPCPAGMSVIGPEYRIKSRETEIVEELKESVARISRSIADSIYIQGGVYSQNKGVRKM